MDLPIQLIKRTGLAVLSKENKLSNLEIIAWSNLHKVMTPLRENSQIILTVDQLLRKVHLQGNMTFSQAYNCRMILKSNIDNQLKNID